MQKNCNKLDERSLLKALSVHAPRVIVLSGAKRSSVFPRVPCNRFASRSRTDSVRSKSPLTASPASPGPLSNSLHGSFHGSLGSDGMSCSSARSSSASPDSARYSSSQVISFVLSPKKKRKKNHKYKSIDMTCNSGIQDKNSEYIMFKV